MSEPMTVNEQLEAWVQGYSYHNHGRDECCPDFSCCNTLMNTPDRDRIRFQKAREEGDEQMEKNMLYGWLGEALAKHFASKKVYLAGDPARELLSTPTPEGGE